MDVEIIEFYADEKKENGSFTGSLHVYVPSLELDIRGVYVKYLPKAKIQYYISLPYKTGYDQETGNKLRYPILSFSDKEKSIALITAIRKQGQEYIEKNFLPLNTKPFSHEKSKKKAPEKDAEKVDKVSVVHKKLWDVK